MENLFHKLEKRKKIKIRQVHILNVQRQLVYDVIYDLVPEGLENRTPYLQKKKRKQEQNESNSLQKPWEKTTRFS